MAQIRYRTLLSHLAQVFQAEDGERTGRLQAGLDDIVAKIDPQDAKTWQLVKDDSERLLRVWAVRDETPGNSALMEQILGALSDYAASVVEEKEVLPSLVITEPVAPAPAPALHSLPSTPVVAPVFLTIATPAIESKDSKEEDEGETEAEGSIVEPDVEEEAEAEGSVVESDVEEEAEAEGSIVEPDVEEEAEAEGSVVEPDVEEEAEAEAEAEEEGMEVDKVMIRGRSYWMDTKTKKLYAVGGDDDVGDEVGAIVNGKAVFVK